MKLAIVGGGASGLMLASILKTNNVDIDIVILEKLDHAGKKILMSGNGKCNLSNTNIDSTLYVAGKIEKEIKVGGAVGYYAKKRRAVHLFRRGVLGGKIPRIRRKNH